MVYKYLIFLQGLSVALAHDAIQVINQGLHNELCSSLNGSNTLPADRDMMLNCIKQVTTCIPFLWNLVWIHLVKLVKLSLLFIGITLLVLLQPLSYPLFLSHAASHVVIFQQVNFIGLTGPVQFDERGKRTEIALDILNLRNNSFQKVRKDISANL